MGLMQETAARSVDTKGQVCPYPIIAARGELKKLQVGEILELVTDYPPTANETLPNLCTSKSYPFEREEIAPGIWKFRIKKTS
jgi:tRNA 2-thiouridine synthesizing protein A